MSISTSSFPSLPLRSFTLILTGVEFGMPRYWHFKPKGNSLCSMWNFPIVPSQTCLASSEGRRAHRPRCCPCPKYSPQFPFADFQRSCAPMKSGHTLNAGAPSIIIDHVLISVISQSHPLIMQLRNTLQTSRGLQSPSQPRPDAAH